LTNEHQPPIPSAIEQVVSRLSELETVLGEPARAVVPMVRGRLIEAMALRDRGDVVGALTRVGLAMDELAGLAERLDPAEAVLMRALAQQFRSALIRGDTTSAKQAAGTMFEKSGARERPKS
jgi:hypothetical protein